MLRTLTARGLRLGNIVSCIENPVAEITGSQRSRDGAAWSRVLHGAPEQLGAEYSSALLGNEDSI